MDKKIKNEFRSFLLKKGIKKNVMYNITSRVGILERLLNEDTTLVFGDYEKSKELIRKLTFLISKKDISNICNISEVTINKCSKKLEINRELFGEIKYDNK